MIIAFITSKWHLANLLAYSRTYNKKIDILVIAEQSNINNSTRFRIQKTDIKKHDDLKVSKLIFGRPKFRLKIMLKNIVELVKSKDKTEIISPGGININCLTSIAISGKCRFTIIDEGTASYVTNIEHFKIAIKSSQSKKFSSRILHWKEELMKKLKPFLSIENFTLFTLKDNQLVVQDRVKKSLLNYYGSHPDNCEVIGERPKILILLDFFDHFGDREYFYQLFQELIEELKLKGEVFIKKHPNDLNDYPWLKGLNILDNSLEAETIASILNPSLVIGGISTSTFTIPNIFGIRTISLLILYLKCKNLDNDYRLRFERFKQYSSSFLEHANSLEDLFDTI